ncbi:TetR/AcrR family transcriptional regulator [uncultured Ferrovibrio sp.]|jgi:AcrR family transcriptional regulator|uniref:TetR/AcrR family transcriptional regulator n=1 Tax=uncultured Ferrovibrio sp. TaxID=1576913 RepID=UPI002625FD53|nr:TetR/AcrR family transcriptional regulator [uncultured Ferrovibrio sp.]
MTKTATSQTSLRETRASHSRRRALEAALALVDAQGVAAMTIEEVRKRSGVSIGSLYHHFRSREGLLAGLYQDLLARYRAVLSAELLRCDGARALVEGFVRTHIAWAAANQAAARFLMEYRHDPAIVAASEAELQSSTAEFIRPILARLKPAMTAGEVRDLPAELLLSLVFGPVQAWLKLWLNGHSGLKPDAAAERLIELIWAALAAPTRNTP